MMNELESRLRSMRLAQPSADLNARIEEAIASARPPEPAKWMPRIWWWLTPATATACLAFLVLLSLHNPGPIATPVVYHIEAEGPLRDMLLNADGGHEWPPPAFSIGEDAP